MKKLALLLLVITLCGPSAFAQKVKIKNVAVVETELDEQSGAANEISKPEVREITAMLRREAVRYLPRNRYNVMTAETVQAMGDAVLAECAEENCVIALGSKIGADYIARGVISKFRQNFSLTVELYETEYGNLIASAAAVRSANFEEILDKGTAACAEMYKTFAESSAQAIPESNPAPKPEAAPAPKPKTVNVKTYKTVVIGGKTWMAENLNYETKDSWCYGGKTKASNCEKYGRLYTWDAARNVCPAGWHLPSREEWKMLVDIAGGSSAAGTKLRSAEWGGTGGTDDYGFSAFLGGGRYADGSFGDLNLRGHWWTATEAGPSNAYRRNMGTGDANVYEGYGSKSNGYSVRCVRD
jgi:uncharacterized protein (TIGR02145 family)